MKKCFGLILAVLLMLLLAGAASAADSSGTCGNGVTWSLSMSTLTISGSGAMDDYTSSSKQPWYAQRTSIFYVYVTSGVTHIGNYAFAGTSIYNISIADTVTSIGKYAVYNCNSLNQITMSKKVETIGSYAFANSSATYPIDLTLPDTLTSLGADAFANQKGLRMVDIPASLQTIPSEAFKGCASLKTLIIRDGIQSVGDSAFHSCTSLTTVILPDSLTYVGLNAFRNCTSLNSVTMGDGITAVKSCAYYGDTSLQAVSFGSAIQTIDSSAFYGCSALKSITLPEGLTKLDTSCFQGCSMLATVYFPPTLTSIMGNAFSSCSKLTAAVLPDNIGTWGSYTTAFPSATTLYAVPGSVTATKLTSGGRAFTAVTVNTFTPDASISLQWFLANGILRVWGTFPQDKVGISALSSITKYPWYSSVSSIKRVEIGSGIEGIGKSMFQGVSLTSAALPSTLKRIGSYAFSGTSLTSVSLPDGLETIDAYAFKSSRLQKLILPDSVTSLGMNAFQSTPITGVRLSESLTEIPSECFAACTSLTTLTVPDSVTTLGVKAFFGCSSLTLVGLGDNIQSIGSQALHKNSSTAYQLMMRPTTTYLTVRDGSVSYEYYLYNYCGTEGHEQDVTWLLNPDKTRLEISGTGEMAQQTTIYWPNITTLTVKEGVTNVPTALCSYNTNLTSVSLASTVTSIANFAFESCSGLTAVSIPSAVTSIGNSAFRGTGLTSIRLGENISTIEPQAFSDCSSLTSVSLEAENIGFLSFANCTALTHVNLGSRLQTIGVNAFYRAESLTGLTIPDTVTAIDNYAFVGMAETAEIYVGDHLTSLGTNAFDAAPGGKVFYVRSGSASQTALTAAGYTCRTANWATYGNGEPYRIVGDTLYIGGSGSYDFKHKTYTDWAPWYPKRSSIKHVVMADTVTKIGDFMFENMTSIEDIRLSANITSIGSTAFRNCPKLRYLILPDNIGSIANSTYTIVTGTVEMMPPFEDDLQLYARTNSTTAAKLNANGMAYTAFTVRGKLDADLEYLLLENGLLKFFGGGVIPDYDRYFDGENVSPFYGLKDSITAIEFSDGITRIGSSAFAYMGGVTELTMPAGLVSIGSYAFDECVNVASLTLNEGLQTIGDEAFCHCQSLQELVIPDSVTYVGSYAFGFSYLNGPRSVVIGSGVTEIPASMLTWAQALTHVEFRGDVTVIGTNAFVGTALTEITLPSTLTTIGSTAFSGSALREVTIPTAVTFIGSQAFPATLQTLVFESGTPMAFAYPILKDEAVTTVRYPHGTSGWAGTAASIGGTVTLSPYCKDDGDIHLNASLTAAGAAGPTCTEAGHTAYWQCDRCGKLFADAGGEAETTAEAVALAATGHTYGAPAFTWSEDGTACTAVFACVHGDEELALPMTVTDEVTLEPGCVTAGTKSFTATLTTDIRLDEAVLATPSDLGDGLVFTASKTCELPALGHTQVVIEGFPATCTEPGLSDEIFCEVCGETLQEAAELPALGHEDTVTAEAAAPTCTEAGHTEEHSCARCGELLQASETIPPTGHTYAAPVFTWSEDHESCTAAFTCIHGDDTLMLDATVTAEVHTAPLCMTEGEELLTATVVTDIRMDENVPVVPSETEDGNVFTATATRTLPALGHQPVDDPAVERTDREPGLTAGSHCARCGEVFIAQEVIPARYTFDGDTVTGYNATETDLIIPDGATALSATLFKGNTDITSVVIPESVTSLGTQTFFGCTGLTDVYLPDNLEGITAQTFYNVTAKLHTSAEGSTAVLLSYRGKSFTTADGLTLRYRVTSASGTPSEAWLIACSGKEAELVLPEILHGAPLTQIQAGAFSACDGLTSVWIPESVTSIDGTAFSENKPVIRSPLNAYAHTWAQENGFVWKHDVHTPFTVTIQEATCTQPGSSHIICEGCGVELEEPVAIPALGHDEEIITAVAPTARQHGFTEGLRCARCGEILTAPQELPAMPMDEADMVFPEGMLNIGDDAFTGLAAQVIALPEGLECIGSGAFAGSTSLRQVYIPASVNEIGEGAFAGTDVIIYGWPDSAAEDFAEINGFIFVFIDPEP